MNDDTVSKVPSRYSVEQRTMDNSRGNAWSPFRILPE